jgi:polysaccharide export outer membrane protein
MGHRFIASRMRAGAGFALFCSLTLSTGAVLIGGAVKAAVLTAPLSPPPSASLSSDYKIGLFDKLAIIVFGVKDLDFDSVPVDASGQIQLPLIGSVEAQGKTSRQLSDEIAQRLNARYLHEAQVSVVVAQSANQKVTVEGAVTDAGVFDIPGRMTLLQAVALAKGPTNRADLKHVAVFREIDGRRDRLTFDVAAIRAGRADDPVMLGNDVVVVSESTSLSAFREVVGDIGAFSIFAIFR